MNAQRCTLPLVLIALIYSVSVSISSSQNLSQNLTDEWEEKTTELLAKLQEAVADDLVVDANLRRRLVGHYQLAPDFIFDVRDRDGRLMVGITNQPTQEVFPNSPSLWSYRGIDATLEFKLTKTGPAKSLVLHQNGIEQTARRLPEKKRYPKRSPFTGVRWEKREPVVKIDEQWYKLISLDGITAKKIVAFSRRNFRNKWQKRFEEDIVELLSRMGHPPQDAVTLVVQSLKSDQTQTLEDVPMTEANRRVIWAAANSRASGGSKPSEDLEFDASDLAIDEKLRSRLAGRYQLNPSSIIDVFDRDGQLMVGATNQANLEVDPDSPTRWSCRAVKAMLEFKLTETGPAESLVLHQSGAKQTAHRIRNDLAIDANLRRRLIGRYQLAPDFIFDVRDRDGHMMVGITNQSTQEVYPDSPTRWSYRGVDATLEFKISKTGRAKSLILHQNDAKQVARRIN